MTPTYTHSRPTSKEIHLGLVVLLRELCRVRGKRDPAIFTTDAIPMTVAQVCQGSIRVDGCCDFLFRADPVCLGSTHPSHRSVCLTTPTIPQVPQQPHAWRCGWYMAVNLGRVLRAHATLPHMTQVDVEGLFGPEAYDVAAVTPSAKSCKPHSSKNWTRTTAASVAASASRERRRMGRDVVKGVGVSRKWTPLAPFRTAKEQNGTTHTLDLLLCFRWFLCVDLLYCIVVGCARRLTVSAKTSFPSSCLILRSLRGVG
jgi:hypothetical protein